MADTFTSNRDGDDHAGATAAPHLAVALTAEDPLAPPSRHRLDGLTEVALGRGDARLVRRHGRTLTVALSDPWLSADHARLRPMLHRWAITDLDSRNGTFVNGVRVRELLLSDGDVIEIGHTFLVFRVAPPDAADRDLEATALDAKEPGLATLSPALARQLARLEQMARSTQSILVEGESGTGKELIARAVHALSGRSGSFVAVNCGALPETLAEAELFGYRRGAFSGAVAERTGYLRAAQGGTLFLDEIADLRLPSQAALLRVVQERQVVPLGDERPVPVDVRFCAATHRSLAELVAAERFRGDLHARLLGFELNLPPLRERREDLGLLLRALLRRGGRTATLTASTARLLFAHRWPHNIRELEQALNAAVALAGDQPIDRSHLPAILTEQAAPPPPSSNRRPLREDELAQRAELARLLSLHRGNVAAVGRAMGKGRQQIHRWLERYDLDLETFRR
jgi:transcriptional regulator with GAF, ATPase, and Fis domain